MLIIGLDSRVDQHGDPLGADVYGALQAGDETDGGYNANVLMLMHIPREGSATGISIPRDDYVDLAGAPRGTAQGKIKEAYGLAFSETLSALTDEGIDEAEAYQLARAAGRQTQISTVSDFLGGVRIDHFIEVTMGGFFEVAKAVEPLTVCLNAATEDAYSGAAFPAGVQEIDAKQAVSFVRQRRDTGDSDLNLTDLDRTHRQQAFLRSLATKVRQAETLTDLDRVQTLLDTVSRTVAVDTDFDLLTFAQRAKHLVDGQIDFVTLPVSSFGYVDDQAVNFVDVDEIRAVVAGILAGAAPAEPAPEPVPEPSGVDVDGAPGHSLEEPTQPTPPGDVACVN
ncbi:LCP family protein [Plantibacter sp. Mn2098]|uniref:LCP family protein n=1 Tax=Plantibacter sp. Mn2098 TaxID=3395266 RepID=UPI003BBF9C9F